MKSTISFISTSILLLFLTSVGQAQDQQPGTIVASKATSQKTDSSKIKKRSKHKKEYTDIAFNPFQPPAAPAKPLPYNSYREQPVPVKEGTGARILKDIITNKKNNKQ